MSERVSRGPCRFCGVPCDAEWCLSCDQAYTAGVQAEREQWEAEIREWLEAYPEDIFVPPLKYEWKMAAEVLKTKGMTLDAISADNMRLVLTRLPERVERRRVEEGE